MRYISDDGKVFNTEYECCEHEKRIRAEKEEELKRKEKLETEKQTRLDNINKKYEELQDLLLEYEKDYSINAKQKPYFAPLYELISILCG